MTASNASPCPPESILCDFRLGKLNAAKAEAVSQHLESCASCRQRAATPPCLPAGAETHCDAEESARQAAFDDTLSYAPPAVATSERSPASAPPALANHPDYEIIKELGRGGMGVVYLAKNRMMERLEVLKVVNKTLVDRRDALDRFQQEIRSAARLAHANIVIAYSVFRLGNLLVLAMEYVPGQDLSHVVKKQGSLPIANATFYAHQVALGLQHAHEKGMVHRDIKPNNLILTVAGKKHIVKILDFGLAKATSEEVVETALTRTGQMLGTPAYIAPEQTVDAHRADIRADIYSLGCTLYHLLAGRPPFEDGSLYGLLHAHQNREAQALNTIREDVPLELAAVVGKMLAKQPAERFQTPIEVARALAPFFRTGQAITPAPQDAEKQRVTSDAEQASGNVAPPGSAVAAPAVYALPVATPVAAPLLARAPADNDRVAIEGTQAAARWGDWWWSLPTWQRMSVVLSSCAAAVVVLGAVLQRQVKQETARVATNDPSKHAVEYKPPAKSAGKPPTEERSSSAGPTPIAAVLDGSQPANWVAMRSLGAHEDVHEPAQSGWDFRGEEIVCATSEPGWLKTKRQFADFELELEYNLPSKTNSGVFIRTPDRGKLSVSGIEVQLLAADFAPRGGRITPDKQTGALMDITRPSQVVQRPVGEWNALAVRCQGDRIQVTLNGTRIVDTNETQCPALRNRPRSGFVGLSNWHGSAKGAAFRKLRIRELTASN